MPKKLLDAEAAETLAALAVNSQLLALKVDKYKSGINKGKYYADYTIGERTVDVAIINILRGIHRNLVEENSLELEFLMPKDAPPFVRWQQFA